MTELMGSCGFNTLRNFNRVFKDITGYAPTALPDGFVLNYRSLATEDNSFDPTLAVSEVLAGTEGEHGSPGWEKACPPLRLPGKKTAAP